MLIIIMDLCVKDGVPFHPWLIAVDGLTGIPACPSVINHESGWEILDARVVGCNAPRKKG
jgi:hypothetical protein